MGELADIDTFDSDARVAFAHRDLDREQKTLVGK